MREARLPRLALLLLRVVPGNRSEDVIGDLEELHAKRLLRSQHAIASLQTVLNAFWIAAAFSVDALKSRSPSMLELKLAVRMMAKQPVLTGVAVLAMAVGIGLATAGYALFDGITNAQLPFDGGKRFVQLEAHSLESAKPIDTEQYRLFKENAPGLAHVGGFWSGDLNVQYANGEVESVRGSWITPRSMGVLPYRPVLGRPLMAADGAAGATPTMVLRESFWRRRFRARPDAVGQTLRVDGVDAQIVGVMPDDLTFPDNVEVWLSLPEPALGEESWSVGGVDVFGVIGDGVTLETARDQLQVANEAATQREVSLRRIALVPFARAWAGPTYELILKATVALLVLVLLIVALNVANLVLARTAARSTELAVRTALGAHRARLVGQVFVEVLVMTTTAAAIGLGGSNALLRWLEDLTQALRPWMSFRPTLKTISFVLLLTAATAAVAAILPALKATRRNTAAELKSAGRSGVSERAFGRAASGMLVAEMALSVALLIAGATMGRAVLAQLTFDLGPVEQSVLTGHVMLPVEHMSYSGVGERPSDPFMRSGRDLALKSDLVRTAIARVPHVIAVGSGALPRTDPGTSLVAVENAPTEGVPTPAAIIGVSEDFFASLGTGVVAGRPFSQEDYSSDVRGAAVIVNETFARRAFGEGNAIGRRITLDPTAAESAAESFPVRRDWSEIVGVVPDLGHSDSHPQNAPAVYLPSGENSNALSLIVLTDGNAMEVEAAVRRAITDVDPLIRMTHVIPLSRVGWESRRFYSGVGLSLIALGVVALLLASAGLYAILAYSVSARTREIGVRVALGAAPWSVLGMVMRRTSVQLLTGGVAGVALTVTLDGLRAKLGGPLPLPGPESWMLPAATLILFASGVIASWIPARRALGITPSEAFRAE